METIFINIYLDFTGEYDTSCYFDNMKDAAEDIRINELVGWNFIKTVEVKI